MIIRTLSILGSLMVLLLAYGIANLGGFFVQVRSVEDHVAFLAPHIRAHFPDGDGPFPTVVQFHGCGSAIASQDDWAAFLVAQGYGAIIVDSLAPRNIDRLGAMGTVCTALQLPGRERAGDVIAGLAYARGRAEVDTTQLFIAGWSHGGWAIMDLMTLDLEASPPPNLTEVNADALGGVRGAILIYPYAGFPARSRQAMWLTNFPVIAFVGAADRVADPDDITSAFAFQRSAGTEIQFDLFDDATHAFDVSHGAFMHQGSYDPVATGQAQQLSLEFLEQLSGD